MPKPTPEQIREAGRQLQRGGLLGLGSSKKAEQVVRQAKDAGLDEQEIAFQIMGAAAETQPRRWARQEAAMENECINCGAPGGYPYCNEACRIADNPDDYDDE